MFSQEISILIGVLSVIFVIIFLSLQSFKKYYVADANFLGSKFVIFFSTIAMGYFITLLGNGDITRELYLSPGVGIGPEGIFDGLYQNSPVLFQIINLLSIFWLFAAIALMPFNHTIINSDDMTIDSDQTNFFKKMHTYIYQYPFKIINILFALTLTLFVYKFCYEYIFRSENATTNLDANNIKGGIGFYYTTLENTIESE
jgi:hypothetical protein